MREIVVYLAQGEGTGPLWVDAFRTGFPGRCIIETRQRPDARQFALFGSPRFQSIIDRIGKTQFDCWYGDHGFFGRGQYYRCAKNSTMFDGASGDDDPKRFRSFGIPIREWRKSGSHVLVCPNSIEFLQRNGASNWVDEIVAKIKANTDRPIRIRWKKEKRPLRHDLENAWATVTFKSNAAVESILAGVPSFCASDCAGLTMGSGDLTQIENPRMPDGREQWAARLANKQWTLTEMARGDLWRAIGC